jgi:hypothetical protein
MLLLMRHPISSRIPLALSLLLALVAPPSTRAEETGRLNLFGHVVVSACYDAVRNLDGVSLSGFSGRLAVKVF